MWAFGYRVDWNGRRVVLSGDTTLSENVIMYGAGVGCDQITT